MSATLSGWSWLLGWPGPIVALIGLAAVGACLFISASVRWHRAVAVLTDETLLEGLEIRARAERELERRRITAERSELRDELIALQREGEALLDRIRKHRARPIGGYQDAPEVARFQRDALDFKIWREKTSAAIRHRLDNFAVRHFQNYLDTTEVERVRSSLERLAEIIAQLPSATKDDAG